MDKVKYCPSCRDKKSPSMCPGYRTVKEDNNECIGCKINFSHVCSITPEELDILIDNKCSIELIDAMVALKDKDIIEFELKMSQFRASATQIREAQQKEREEAKKPKCPRCNSTNIQVVPRKWSLMSGFLTNKTDRVCVNCKHKW